MSQFGLAHMRLVTTILVSVTLAQLNEDKAGELGLLSKIYIPGAINSDPLDALFIVFKWPNGYILRTGKLKKNLAHRYIMESFVIFPVNTENLRRNSPSSASRTHFHFQKFLVSVLN